jgi:hypothetical protein
LTKKASLSEVCLKDKHEKYKYKYRPQHTYFEVVLFLLITYEGPGGEDGGGFGGKSSIWSSLLLQVV